MTPAEASLENRCLAAAAARYASLDSRMYVELGGLMPHKSVRLATDAACALVRPELESTYAALLEANALRDEALARVRELEAELAEAKAGRETFRRTLEQDARERTRRRT